MNTQELINIHKKSVVGRILEWMDANDLTKDAQILVMSAVAKAAKSQEDGPVYNYLMTESKLIGETISDQAIWESISTTRTKKFNKELLEHYTGLAKKEFNKLIKTYPLSLGSYELDVLNAVMNESKLSNPEKRSIVKAFVIGNDDIVVEDYNSAIKKMTATVKLVEEVESFDYELNSVIFMENNRIIREDEESEKRTAEKEREQEREEESEKNKEEFAADNIAKAKNQNAPLAKALRAQGMSQDEAADALDVDKSTISRIKSGVRKPSYELLKKMSGKFGSIDNLFPELS